MTNIQSSAQDIHMENVDPSKSLSNDLMTNVSVPADFMTATHAITSQNHFASFNQLTDADEYPRRHPPRFFSAKNKQKVKKTSN